MTDYKNQILDLMNAESTAFKSGELAEKLNIDKKEVDKAIKALVKEEKVFSPKRCYYSSK
jgi:predicted transcriptional regulator